jgi:hypothetical protein
VELYLYGCEICQESQSRLLVRRAALSPKGLLCFTGASQTVLPAGEGARLLKNPELA